MIDLPGLITDLLRRVAAGDFEGVQRQYDEGALDALKPHLSDAEWADLPARIRSRDAGWLRGLFTRLSGSVLGGIGGAGAVAGAAGAALGGAGRAAGGAGVAAAAGAAGRGGAGWLKWAVPAVIGVAAIGFGLSRCGGDDASTTAATSGSGSSVSATGAATPGEASGAAAGSSDGASVSADAGASAGATGDDSMATPSGASTGAASASGAGGTDDASAAPAPSASPSTDSGSGSTAGTTAAQSFVVYFDTGSAVIRPDAAAVIKKAAAAIPANVTVQLTGVADVRGNAQANLALSKRRAAAVEAALKAAGAKSATYTLQAKGVEAGSDLQKARRVEIKIS